MNARDFRRYKQLLLAKRDEVLASRSEDKGLAPAAGHVGGDLVDQASAFADATVRIRLQQTEGHLLRAIEEAVGRIEQGTFGVCMACGKPISKARLNAVPWTRLCRDCKEQQNLAAKSG